MLNTRAAEHMWWNNDIVTLYQYMPLLTILCGYVNGYPQPQEVDGAAPFRID